MSTMPGLTWPGAAAAARGAPAGREQEAQLVAARQRALTRFHHVVLPSCRADLRVAPGSGVHIPDGRPRTSRSPYGVVTVLSVGPAGPAGPAGSVGVDV